MRTIIRDVLTVTMNGNREIDFLTIVIEGELIRKLARSGVVEKKGDRVLKGDNMIALPGLINGHVHGDIALARGLGDGYTLYEQDYDSPVSRKKWFRDELNREARHYSRLLQYVESVKGGTTFICDVPFWWYGDDIAAPFYETGIAGGVVLDYRKDFLTGEEVPPEEYAETAGNLREKGIIPIVEAPAEEDFDEGLLLGLHRRAVDLDTLIQLHLAETTWRLGIIRERYDCTPVQYLDRIGFLDGRVIGSHGVWLTPEDRNLLKNRGARIVNCPIAEMKIADGVAPVQPLIGDSVPVGLGSDGALWNDASDMFSEMKTLLLLQRLGYGASSMSCWDTLYAATRGGAEVFGMGGELGSIEEGKRASLVLIDCLKPHLAPLYTKNPSNVIQLLTCCARGSDVDTVIVNGRIVVEGGRMTTIDERSLLTDCSRIARERFEGKF